MDRCFNGGNCIDGIDSFFCECTPKHSGSLCECNQDVEQCVELPKWYRNQTYRPLYDRPTLIPPPDLFTQNFSREYQTKTSQIESTMPTVTAKTEIFPQSAKSFIFNASNDISTHSQSTDTDLNLSTNYKFFTEDFTTDVVSSSIATNTYEGSILPVTERFTDFPQMDSTQPDSTYSIVSTTYTKNVTAASEYPQDIVETSPAMEETTSVHTKLYSTITPLPDTTAYSASVTPVVFTYNVSTLSTNQTPSTLSTDQTPSTLSTAQTPSTLSPSTLSTDQTPPTFQTMSTKNSSYSTEDPTLFSQSIGVVVTDSSSIPETKVTTPTEFLFEPDFSTSSYINSTIISEPKIPDLLSHTIIENTTDISEPTIISAALTSSISYTELVTMDGKELLNDVSTFLPTGDMKISTSMSSTTEPVSVSTYETTSEYVSMDSTSKTSIDIDSIYSKTKPVLNTELLDTTTQQLESSSEKSASDSSSISTDSRITTLFPVSESLLIDSDLSSTTISDLLYTTQPTNQYSTEKSSFTSLYNHTESSTSTKNKISTESPTSTELGISSTNVGISESEYTSLQSEMINIVNSTETTLSQPIQTAESFPQVIKQTTESSFSSNSTSTSTKETKTTETKETKTFKTTEYPWTPITVPKTTSRPVSEKNVSRITTVEPQTEATSIYDTTESASTTFSAHDLQLNCTNRQCLHGGYCFQIGTSSKVTILGLFH